MTSNLAGPEILARSGRTDGGTGVDADARAAAAARIEADVEALVRGRLKDHFRPEFLNRVDDMIVFKPLSRKDLKEIVDIQMARVADLARQQDVALEVDAGAKARIAAEGYDPAFGARPLKRAVQRLVQDPLAMAILEGDVTPGSAVRVEANEAGDELVFRVEAEEGR